MELIQCIRDGGWEKIPKEDLPAPSSVSAAFPASWLLLDPTPVDLGPGTGETFVCPKGATCGDRVELKTQSGRLMTFTIPSGTNPGDEFEAPVNIPFSLVSS